MIMFTCERERTGAQGIALNTSAAFGTSPAACSVCVSSEYVCAGNVVRISYLLVAPLPPRPRPLSVLLCWLRPSVCGATPTQLTR
jgi:hypothetical protein